MTKTSIVKSLLVTGAVVAVHFSYEILAAVSITSSELSENLYLRDFCWKLLNYGPVLLVCALLFWQKMPFLLGLRHSLVKSFGVAFLFTIPMYLSFLIFFKVNLDLTGLEVFKNSLLSAVFEEVVFRAFVFGALYGLCQWRFLPAVLLPAVVFGLGHLYQANDLTGALFTFLVTFTGAIWFSWLYVKWGFNLFIPIFLHLLMNFSWTLFNVSDGAAGGIVANLARIGTIMISIYVTLRWANKQSFSLKKLKVEAVDRTLES